MDLKLPKLGEGADSGVVVSILVKEGDAIQEGQTILELENEKAVAPIPASASGTVAKLRVKEGDNISIGQVILTLAGEGEAVPQPAVETDSDAQVEASAPPVSAPPPAASSPVVVVEEVPEKSNAPIAAAPTIRKLAQDLGIDLTRVRGTERGGRIGMVDLRRYIELLQRLAFQRKDTGVNRVAAPAAPIDFAKWGPVTRKPLTPLRKVIGQRMADSWLAVPRVTQFDEADITQLNALRKKLAPAYEKQGTRLTLTVFALKAVASVLKQHPLFNSSLDETAGELVLKDYIHIGLAVDTDAGLMVPVIRDVDKKSAVDLAREVEDLATRSRERKVSLEELKGGSFTISNQGGIGGAHFTPIVNTPEVAILGLGRGSLKPKVVGDKLKPRLLMPLAVSYDHRVIDGGNAARFVVDLVKAFEDFPEDAAKL